MLVKMSESGSSLRKRQRSERQSQSQSKSLRIRSASVGRSRDYDLRCRYWAFLFDNLHRAVDEIYQNCEKDESIVECKEAILVLDNYTREFQALIQWLNLNIDYESTPPPNRPNSLTWEVRKSLPKQNTFWNTFFSRNLNSINSDTKLQSKNENCDNKEKCALNNNNNNNIIENEVQNSCEDSNGNIEPQLINGESDIKEQKIDTKNDCNDQTICASIASTITCTRSPPTTMKLSKPLNPLARTFKSKIYPTAAVVKITQTANNNNNNTVNTQVSQNMPLTTAAPKLSAPVSPKITNKIILNHKSDINNKTKIIVTENERTPIKSSVSASDLRITTRIESRKPPLPVIRNNFIKETNSSRAKNIKNELNNNLLKKNNILNVKNSKENINQNRKNGPVISKTKRVKDADGWELVRGRQRFKASPPKVIIVEDEAVIKTTADGTVIAVTASSQTNSDWQPISPDLFSSWPPPNQRESDLLRTPGRALQMHEKLSSPSRKRSISESFRIHEQKLAKAQEAREKFLEKKAQRFKGIVKKVEEMKNRKEEQQLQLKLSMEMKLQKAEEKRNQQLRQIVRKAHDEESKVNEIQFINTLEAQNKRCEILNKEKDIEMRLADIQEERQRKLEEKAAKEAAAEERRKALEEERQARINELQERRKLKDQKIEQQLLEKEKERIELATQKALDRQSRISAINALHQANVEELQKKIQLKQEESKRRHEENMEQIRQKALELSVKKSSAGNDDAPPCTPYDTMKMCSLCKVVIKSEVFLFGHLRGKKHNDAICEQNNGQIPTSEELENYNLKHIIEAPKQLENDIKAMQFCDNEKLKSARKKLKKLKMRMLAKGNEYESNWKEKISKNKSIHKNLKIGKLLKNLNMLSEDTQITGQWPSNMIHSLERNINELEKSFKDSGDDVIYFYSINGISTITKLLSRILNGTNERPTSLTDRAYSRLANLYETLCIKHYDINYYTLQSNNMTHMLDILMHRINLLDANLTNPSLNAIFDVVIGSLCRLLSTIFNSLYHYYSLINDKTDDYLFFFQTIQEVISYIVKMGMIDKLSLIISNIRGPIDETTELAYFFKHVISLFTSLSDILSLQQANTFGVTIKDETQFMMTLRMTHLCGVVSLIYGLLLHSGAPVRGDNTPPIASSHALELTLEAIQFINHIALLDLNMTQSILGGEGLSFQLRHICSYLIWYCSHHKATQLLHELILFIGNFVVLNCENQTLIQSGQRPTVVQQLCLLPMEYFSNEKLSRILFPTLIACCFNNKENRIILEQEMSTLMLSTFIETTIVELQLKAVDADMMGKSTPIVEERWSFAVRFPKNRWNQARDYFESQLNTSI